jgi:glyoxylase-like metal-dependent hydrolase (beta-lactamase superfamily II)
MGIIDLGSDVVLFDAGQSAAAATDLFDAARRLTGRDPTILVYSHGHNDHVRGAAALPKSLTVIATKAIEDDIVDDAKTAAADSQDIYNKLWLYRRYETWESQIGPPGEARFWRGYFEAIAQSGLQYVARLPTRYIDNGTMTLSGPRRKVVLKVLSGHTASDVIAVLPDDRIVFAGDLLFVNRHPFLGDSPGSGSLLAALDALQAEAPARYVPGHGDVAGAEAIASMRDYVLTLRDLVEEGRHRGLSGEWLSTRPVPPQFSSWWFGRFFPTNMKVLFKEAEKAKSR